MNRAKYRQLVRHYRDNGPDPTVHDAYIAGLNGYQRKWRPGTVRGAAYAAGTIIRLRDQRKGLWGNQ